MKNDITQTTDIHLLIDHFYANVQKDTLIGPIFNNIVHVDWAHHLPVMYAFWDFLLLGGKNYTGNPIQKHLDLHQVHPLTEADFDRWLELFQDAVDTLFEGPKAEEAKFRAMSIAAVWKPKFTATHGIGLPK